MTESVIAVVLVVAILCFFDVRLGMYLTLLAGFLQDPIRKIVPDSPVYLSTIVLVFAAATFAGAALAGALRPLGTIPGWDARLKSPILLFVGLVTLQSIASFLYTGSLFLAGIGLLVYLAPLPALLLAYSFASTVDRLRLFFWFYIVLSASMVSGVYLSWLGFDWDILQSVGQPLVVFSLETGEPLELPAGFLRAPEVAAWHAASGACCALMLGMSGRRRDTGLTTVALAIFFIGAVILTGRRKFLVEIFAFVPLLWWLMWRFRMATGRVLYLLFALAVAGSVVMVTGLAESNTREAFEAPVVRGEGRANEILERISNVTVGAVPHIIDTNGFFGSGAGSGSGGAQYYGGGDERVGLAAEGGLGKVLAELGVPGVLMFMWLGFLMTVQVWRALGQAVRGDPEVAKLVLGITAFLAANAFVFIGAHQAYSDPFVLLFLGVCLGFVLATHRLQQADGASLPPMRRRRAAFGARGLYP